MVSGARRVSGPSVNIAAATLRSTDPQGVEKSLCESFNQRFVLPRRFDNHEKQIGLEQHRALVYNGAALSFDKIHCPFSRTPGSGLFKSGEEGFGRIGAL